MPAIATHCQENNIKFINVFKIHVGYMPVPVLKIAGYIMMATAFAQPTMKCIKRLSTKKRNSYFTDNFNEHSNIIMFRGLGPDIYTMRDRFICIDYLCFHQHKYSNNDRNFSNTRSDKVSGKGIPDVLMNLMSCHGFAK